MFIYPIHSSIVPSVSLPQPYLDYGLCFLNHPYTMNVVLQNSQPLLAHYEIMKLVFEGKSPALQSPQEHV